MTDVKVELSCDSSPHTWSYDVSPNRSRFVTACQQVLALGVVLAALTPATSVVTLEDIEAAAKEIA